MSIAYRQLRIVELLKRFRSAEIAGRWHVRNLETGQLLERADYDTQDLAEAKCRSEAAAEIERLYLWDRATAVRQIEHLVGQHPFRPAEQIAPDIFDLFADAKA